MWGVWFRVQPLLFAGVPAPGGVFCVLGGVFASALGVGCGIFFVYHVFGTGVLCWVWLI